MADQGAGVNGQHAIPTELILDSISEGVFTIDADWRVTFFNRAAETITGVPRDEAVGRRCWAVFRTTVCESACPLRTTLDSGEPAVDRKVFIVNAEGRRIPIRVSTAVLRDDAGRVMGGVEMFRDMSVLETLREEVRGKTTFGDLHSRNHRMRELFRLIPQVAESGVTVLIRGESGTGKELLARALHQASPRRDVPMVTVNCAALPEGLLESELFGHVAGAFTDARTDRQGRFAQADGGTIFLDEIGEMSPAMQVRLLRVLQEKSFEPVGSSQTQTVDVRVITATHRDLEAMVDDGSFRSDLFYRINVVKLEIPPLRERKDDILLLVDHFLERHARLQDKSVDGISTPALHTLLRHDWPGNVRELENAVEHALVLHAGGLVETDQLPAYLTRGIRDAADPMRPGTLKDMEIRLIRDALERHGGKRGETAEELGIHRTTLLRKMKAYGIASPQKEDPDEEEAF